MKEQQNLIHVKIDYEEALQSKRDILASEKDILQILKTLKRYHLLRKEELTLKLKLQVKIKELELNLKKLSETLPKVKTSPLPKKEESKDGKATTATPKTKEEKEEDDLEKQLREIQDKLRSLN